jgi:hypothetical protein
MQASASEKLNQTVNAEELDLAADDIADPRLCNTQMRGRGNLRGESIHNLLKRT